MISKLKYTTVAAFAALAFAVVPAAATASSGGTSPGDSRPPSSASVKRAKALSGARILRGVKITEYYPAPEKWFRGKRVSAPGITGKHRIDWLYSARGLPMEGDGVDLSGKRWHFEGSQAGGWVNRSGQGSGASGSYWLDAMYWRNSRGQVTYPLESGGWSNGNAKGGAVSSKNTRFGPGLSLPLRYWQSVAVDRSVIRRGSGVYISRFRNKPGGGYMCAQDTGGAIIGRHIDVFTPSPSTPDGGESYSNQTVRVIAPSSARVILPFCR